MRKSLFFYFVLIGLNCFAQPGYLGKKSNVAYSFELSPIFPGFHANFLSYLARLSELPPPFIQTGHSLSYGYSVSRKHEIYSTFSYRRLNCTLELFQDRDDGTLEPLTTKTFATQYTVDLGVRRYFRNFIAPIGLYYQYSIGFIDLSFDPNLKDVEFRTTYNQPHVILENKFDRLQFPHISGGIGIKKAINKTLYYQTDFQFNIILKRLEYKKNEGSLYFDRDEYYTNMMGRNFNYVKNYSFRFGIGCFF